MAGKKAKAKARKAADTAPTVASAASTSSEYITIKPAGAKGYGAFATKAIEAGTVIHKETSIMTIHKHIDTIMPWDVNAAYCKLSPEDKKSFDKMRKCVCDLPYCVGKFQIFAGNMFNVAEDWSIVGAYDMASRFNNGCAANCLVGSKDCKGEQRVSDAIAITAYKDIAEGEELTFWYCEDVQYMTTSERQALYADKATRGWTCVCDLCSLPPKERLASDLRRSIMRHLHYWIRQKGQDLPTVPSTIESPIRKLNSFEEAMYQLLWAHLAEAEGLRFETCRWRWWGYAAAVLYVLTQARDKHLTRLTVDTAEHIREWIQNAHEAVSDGKELTMDQDVRLHAAAVQFVLCVEDDGTICWEEMRKDEFSVLRAWAGTVLDR